MRKNLLSCLTLLMVMLISGVASAQWTSVTAGLPSVSFPATNAGDVKDTAYIYICKSDPRPIDLTYDVLGKHLPADQGGWKFVGGTNGITQSPQTIPAGAQYDYDGRNVFKGITPGVGTYIFEFTNELAGFCGLAADEKLWAVVFILPDFKDVADKLVEVCYDTPLSAAQKKDPIFTFFPGANDLQTIINAGYKLQQTAWVGPLPAGNVKTESVHVGKVRIDTNGMTLPAYPCLDSAQAKLTVRAIDTVLDITAYGRTIELCMYDMPTTNIAATNAAMDAWFASKGLLHSFLVGKGTWSTTGINWATDFPTTGTTKSYTLTVPNGDCYVGGNIVFTYNAVQSYTQVAPIDTTTCETTGTKWLGDYTAGPPVDYNSQIVEWVSIGLDKSAPGTFGAGGNPMITGNNIDFSKFAKGSPYYFAFNFVDSALLSTCHFGNGDTLTIVVNSSVSSQDGRLQVCKDAAAQTVNLTNLIGVPGAIWSVGSSTSPAVNAATGVVTIPAGKVGTFKYSYNVPSIAGLCGSGSGVFYLKITDNVVVSEKITEKFCVENLSNVNIYYIAGLTNGGVSVTVTGTSVGGLTISNATLLTYLNTTTGAFDLMKLKADYPSLGNVDETINFTISGVGCAKTTTVNVQLVITKNIL